MERMYPNQLARIGVSDEGSCHRAGQCKTRRVWEYLSNSINDLLQSISLQDMLEQEQFGITKES